MIQNASQLRTKGLIGHLESIGKLSPIVLLIGLMLFEVKIFSIDKTEGTEQVPGILFVILLFLLVVG